MDRALFLRRKGLREPVSVLFITSSAVLVRPIRTRDILVGPKASEWIVASGACSSHNRSGGAEDLQCLPVCWASAIWAACGYSPTPVNAKVDVELEIAEKGNLSEAVLLKRLFR